MLPLVPQQSLANKTTNDRNQREDLPPLVTDDRAIYVAYPPANRDVTRAVCTPGVLTPEPPLPSIVHQRGRTRYTTLRGPLV